MKMAKPSARDIEAAEELLQILQLIDARFGGPWANPDAGDSLSELLQDGEEEFDCDNTTHLQTLYNNLARLLRTSPAFYGRVISGMCHVIMYEKNQIIDPESDCIDLHPRFAQLAKDANRYRWLRDHGFSHADVSLGTDSDGDNFVGYRVSFNVPEAAHSKFEDDEWEAPDIDAAVDAALAAQQPSEVAA